MKREEIKQLLERYADDQCTAQEKTWIEDWYNTKHIKADVELSDEQLMADTDEIWANLPKPAPSYTIWLKIVAAAAAITLTFILGMHVLEITKKEPVVVALENVSPGGNKAVLTLADGRKISLTDAANGELAKQQGIQITKTADGQLVYTIDHTTKDAANTTALNTITTPNGGQYQVRLPDGTQVWLNAASTLSYATNVSAAKERMVRLSGEAYFEVTHDASKQFIVKTNTQQIEVLGTHFNVNSYADEGKTITTLAEGSVKVWQNDNTVRLKPGQQAISSNGAITIQPADLETALAWKEGRIEFRDANLQQIMRMIGRWYNVQVRFEGTLANRTFSGSIPRNKNLAVVLKTLESSHINFVLEQVQNGEKTLIVKP
jgi:transmembrane sensor